MLQQYERNIKPATYMTSAWCLPPAPHPPPLRSISINILYQKHFDVQTRKSYDERFFFFFFNIRKIFISFLGWDRRDAKKTIKADEKIFFFFWVKREEIKRSQKYDIQKMLVETATMVIVFEMILMAYWYKCRKWFPFLLVLSILSHPFYIVRFLSYYYYHFT